MDFNLSIPTHIIVGSPDQTSAAVINGLRSIWCKNKVEGCFCSVCKQLSHHQHRFLAWIKPKKDYTVEDLSIIFEISSLALDPGQLFFFVLEQSEKLTQATANRLLKNLEEPHEGYHFILLTDNLNALLPTIISRSEVITLARSQDAALHPLVDFFTKKNALTNVQEFEQYLYKNKLSDSESQQIFDELFEYTEKELAKTILEKNDLDDDNDAFLYELVEFLQNAMKMPPQSGSSDLFWKNLWISYPRKK